MASDPLVLAPVTAVPAVKLFTQNQRLVNSRSCQDVPMQRILNIPIQDPLLKCWANWLAPEKQPFYLTSTQSTELALDISPPPPFSPEWRDTFHLWGVTCPQVALLSESDFMALPVATRAELLRIQLEHRRGQVMDVDDWRDLLPEVSEQAGGEHFVWWPSLFADQEWAVISRWSSHDRLPCQHQAVSEDVWDALGTVLPRARELAGTFASRSGPNCLGTVMASAGVVGAEHEWMLHGPFEEWLATRTVHASEVEAPGTVLVWRNHDGQAQHAAVTLGGGYVLHKPSQCWDSPRQVIRLDDVHHQFDDDDTVVRCFTLGSSWVSGS